LRKATNVSQFEPYMLLSIASLLHLTTTCSQAGLPLLLVFWHVYPHTVKVNCHSTRSVTALCACRIQQAATRTASGPSHSRCSLHEERCSTQGSWRATSWAGQAVTLMCVIKICRSNAQCSRCCTHLCASVRAGSCSALKFGLIGIYYSCNARQ
jgi:hypothetical protein